MICNARFTSQRLFVEDRLAKDINLRANREQANYLLNVLRLKSGDRILLFNGLDGEWPATIEPAGRKACTLQPLHQTRPQPDPPVLQYLFAPLKHARLDYMIQKAVEMGAGLLQPVLTQYTQTKTISSKRMRANAIEAAEQCGILSLPEIREPVKFEILLDNWDNARPMIFCDEAAELKNPVEALSAIRTTDCGVLIGPEGGFSRTERDKLMSCSFVTAISLGPRILRADTAAVAALSILNAVAG